MNVVLSAAKNIEGLLRRPQVRTPVSGDIEFKTQVFPGREGKGNIPSIQWLARPRQAVQRIGEKSVATVKLATSVIVRLGMEA